MFHHIMDLQNSKWWRGGFWPEYNYRYFDQPSANDHLLVNQEKVLYIPLKKVHVYLIFRSGVLLIASKNV